MEIAIVCGNQSFPRLRPAFDIRTKLLVRLSKVVVLSKCVCFMPLDKILLDKEKFSTPVFRPTGNALLPITLKQIVGLVVVSEIRSGM